MSQCLCLCNFVCVLDFLIASVSNYSTVDISFNGQRSVKFAPWKFAIHNDIESSSSNPFLYFLWSLLAFSRGRVRGMLQAAAGFEQCENNFGSALFHHLLLSEVCFWSRSLNTCFLPWCVKSGTWAGGFLSGRFYTAEINGNVQHASCDLCLT